MVNNAQTAIVFKKQMKSQICLFIIAIFQTVRSQILPTIASLGQQCGGESLSPVPCEPGLTCILPKTDTFFADAPGICIKVVGAGEPCGGYYFTAPRCNTGFKCVRSPGAAETDGGVCKENDTSEF